MPISVTSQDTVWNRRGDPMKVEQVNPKTGDLILNANYKDVQENSKYGIKNGLEPNVRTQFISVLDDSKDSNKQQEIRNLFTKLNDLKAGRADPRLIKYIDSELKFRIAQEEYKPDGFAENPLSLNI